METANVKKIKQGYVMIERTLEEAERDFIKYEKRQAKKKKIPQGNDLSSLLSNKELEILRKSVA